MITGIKESLKGFLFSIIVVLGVVACLGFNHKNKEIVKEINGTVLSVQYDNGLPFIGTDDYYMVEVQTDEGKVIVRKEDDVLVGSEITINKVYIYDMRENLKYIKYK